MSKAQELLNQAREFAQSAESWADLSNALYDPDHGILTQAFKTRAEREAFAQTTEYHHIRALLEETRDRFGLVAGATPKKCGRLVVDVPLSLHSALQQEAFAEGVSVDQLVVAKLAAQLKHLAGAG